MAHYNGHEVEVVQEEGQAVRIVGGDDVTVNQEGEDEGGWVFSDELDGYES